MSADYKVVEFQWGFTFINIYKQVTYWQCCEIASNFGFYTSYLYKPSELRSNSIVEGTFSKPVKTQKCDIKSCYFVENIVKI